MSKAKDLTGQRFEKLIAIEWLRDDSGKRIWKCQCDCGNITYAPAGMLSNNGKKSCSCDNPSQKKNLLGEKFGKLTVLQDAGKNASGYYTWYCICECGNTKIVSSNHLLNERIRSCGCLYATKRKQYNDLSYRYWNSIIKNAKIRKIAFNITIEEAWNLYEKQNRKCALTGVDIVFVVNYNINCTNQTASLDRIDNKIGYQSNNIQWIHKIVNRYKNILSNKELIDFSILIAKHNAPELFR